MSSSVIHHNAHANAQRRRSGSINSLFDWDLDWHRPWRFDDDHWNMDWTMDWDMDRHMDRHMREMRNRMLMHTPFFDMSPFFNSLDKWTARTPVSSSPLWMDLERDLERDLEKMRSAMRERMARVSDDGKHVSFRLDLPGHVDPSKVK